MISPLPLFSLYLVLIILSLTLLTIFFYISHFLSYTSRCLSFSSHRLPHTPQRLPHISLSVPRNSSKRTKFHPKFTTVFLTYFSRTGMAYYRYIFINVCLTYPYLSVHHKHLQTYIFLHIRVFSCSTSFSVKQMFH